jgi:phosphoglycerate dehydrogenase-like enzyme
MIDRLLASLLLVALLSGGPVRAASPGPGDEARRIIAELQLQEAPAPISDHDRWQPRRVVVTAPPFLTASAPDFAERLRAVAGGVELVIDTSGDMVPAPELLVGADALIGFCSAPALAAAGARFLWLHNYFVGMDRCAGVPQEQVSGRVFTNGKRLSGPAIAEHAMAMLLSLARGLPAYQRAQAKGEWDRALSGGVSFGELDGKTLLVVGLGGIGTEVARRAHGLGMRVIATRRSSREGPEFVDRVGLGSELLTLAAQAQAVVNALPLTDETRGLFDAGFFRTLPQGAIFISVGRGASTVTADLVAALESGRLYGAGLDVTDPEPLPVDSPLWQMPNVIITPHVSASGGDSQRRGAAIAVENLRRYVAGEPLLNPVDMAAGY